MSTPEQRCEICGAWFKPDGGNWHECSSRSLIERIEELESENQDLRDELDAYESEEEEAEEEEEEENEEEDLVEEPEGEPR
jgi:hypothetical protein